MKFCCSVTEQKGGDWEEPWWRRGCLMARREKRWVNDAEVLAGGGGRMEAVATRKVCRGVPTLS